MIRHQSALSLLPFAWAYIRRPSLARYVNTIFAEEGNMESASETRLTGVLASVDDRADEIVAFAAELIRKRSVNPDLEPNPLAERPAQEWLRDRLEESQAFDIVDSWAVAESRPNV